MQINDDGTHAILPVATHFKCTVDHAGVPVMWLRHADGKLRRDGIPAAPLPCCSDLTPSVSAEECTAHGDSLLWWRIAFQRGAEGLVANEKGSENG